MTSNENVITKIKEFYEKELWEKAAKNSCQRTYNVSQSYAMSSSAEQLKYNLQWWKKGGDYYIFWS